MSTWEERMSAKHGGMGARERQSFGTSYAERFTLEELRERGYVRGTDGRWRLPEPPEGPDDYCRDCCEWDSDEGIYRVSCGHITGPDGCRLGHQHHCEEVWLA